MRFTAGSHTDIGTRKTVNQDAYGLRVVESGLCELAFAVVCDGVGGMSEGEVASGVVVCSFLEWFEGHMAQLFLDGLSEDEVLKQWDQTAQRANACIFAYGKEKQEHIGTTATVFLAVYDRVFFMNIGDTRLYRADQEGLHLLSKDHTLVQQEVEQGMLTPEEARADKRKNILTRCLGAEARAVPDFYSDRFCPGSLWLLCTDGFRNRLEENELYRGVSPERVRRGEDISELLRRLTQTVKERGERDNITAAAIYMDETADSLEQTVDLEDTVNLRCVRERIQPEAIQLWRDSCSDDRRAL